MNEYYRWLYGADRCGCNNGYGKIDDCDCEEILLRLTNAENDIIAISGDTDLSNYYTKAEVDALIPSLSGYATEAWVLNKNYLTDADLSDYATEEWVLNKHYLTNADMSDYALKSEIPVVPTNVSSFNNDAGYLTDVDLSDYALKSDIPTSNSAFTNDAGYLTDVDLSNYALKSEIPVVPTSNSAFTNDMHYITSAETYSKTEVNNIVNNKFWCGTQQEYDAIVNKENGVLYLIYE